MSDTLIESALSPRVPKADTSGHTSLFPSEPVVRKPPKRKPQLSVSSWFRQWLPDGYKGLGHRIFRAERAERQERDPNPNVDVDGDPEADGKHLGKILRGENNRHFDIDWLLTHFADEFGAEGKEAFATFLLELWGFQAPVWKADPLRAEQRRAEAAAMLKTATETFKEAMQILSEENEHERAR